MMIDLTNLICCVTIQNMKPIVYIETSIPSFYYEIRTEPDMIARQNWTREWWDNCRDHYTLVTSAAVLEELQNGDYPNQEKVIALLNPIPLLPMEDPLVSEIVKTYLNHQLMPRNPKGDALHLALASYHRCDFLLTWNCRNLANANKFKHLERIHNILSLPTPLLVTPVQLLGDNKYDKQ